jgi:glycosyltransferase involved in cell wall biosynthesis
MPQKILYIHGIQEIGGAETDLLAILAHLDRDQFHPAVACPPTGAFVERLKEMSIPVFSLSLPAWRKLKDAWRIPIAVLSLAAILKREHFALVHINDYWWTPIAWLACRFGGIPCLVHIRQQIEPRRVRQYWLTKPQRVLAISEEIRKVAVNGGVNPQHIQVVYSGIDLTRLHQVREGLVRTRYGLQPGQPVICAVANLFPRKGYEYLLEALVPVRNILPQVHCLIVGEGDNRYQAKLLNLLRTLDLKAVVTFTGFQSNVLEYLADCDVVVLPSIMEGFGIVLLEAMGMGKPVVASRVGGIPEVIEDGATGILVPPANPQKLAEALILLLKDSTLRQTMGKAGKVRVERDFSLKMALREIEDSYHALLSPSVSKKSCDR